MAAGWIKLFPKWRVFLERKGIFGSILVVFITRMGHSTLINQIGITCLGNPELFLTV
jgi:hypothetical protein